MSYTLQPRMSPDMMQAYKTLLSKSSAGGAKGLDYLSGLASGDEAAFAQEEAPAYRSFDKLLGNIGSRFADVGAVGSSAFQNATSGAAQGLAENLSARRGDLQRKAIERLLGISTELLGNNPYGVQEEDQGFDWGSLLGGLGGIAGSAFLGPAAGAAGQGIGDWISKLFKGRPSQRGPMSPQTFR